MAGDGSTGSSSRISTGLPHINGHHIFSSILIILGNLLADVSYAYADPRIRVRPMEMPHDP